MSSRARRSQYITAGPGSCQTARWCVHSELSKHRCELQLVTHSCVVSNRPGAALDLKTVILLHDFFWCAELHQGLSCNYCREFWKVFQPRDLSVWACEQIAFVLSMYDTKALLIAVAIKSGSAGEMCDSGSSKSSCSPDQCRDKRTGPAAAAAYTDVQPWCLHSWLWFIPRSYQQTLFLSHQPACFYSLWIT